MGLGFRGLGFWGFGFRVLGFRVLGSGFGGLGFGGLGLAYVSRIPSSYKSPPFLNIARFRKGLKTPKWEQGAYSTPLLLYEIT